MIRIKESLYVIRKDFVHPGALFSSEVFIPRTLSQKMNLVFDDEFCSWQLGEEFYDAFISRATELACPIVRVVDFVAISACFNVELMRACPQPGYALGSLMVP